MNSCKNIVQQRGYYPKLEAKHDRYKDYSMLPEFRGPYDTAFDVSKYMPSSSYSDDNQYDFLGGSAYELPSYYTRRGFSTNMMSPSYTQHGYITANILSPTYVRRGYLRTHIMSPYHRRGFLRSNTMSPSYNRRGFLKDSTTSSFNPGLLIRKDEMPYQYRIYRNEAEMSPYYANRRGLLGSDLDVTTYPGTVPGYYTGYYTGLVRK